MYVLVIFKLLTYLLTCLLTYLLNYFIHGLLSSKCFCHFILLPSRKLVFSLILEMYILVNSKLHTYLLIYLLTYLLMHQLYTWFYHFTSVESL